MGLQALGQHRLDLALRTVGIGDGKGCGHAIVWFALESLYLTLTFDDKTYGNALYTTCRQGGLDLTPQDGRQLEAYQTVEHTAGLLGVHQVHVNVTRGFDSLEDGRFGNFVEHDTVGMLLVQSEHLAQVP